MFVYGMEYVYGMALLEYVYGMLMELLFMEWVFGVEILSKR